MNSNEQKLVEQAKEGNMAAFEELYKSNREKIFRLTHGFVNNNADAEDLLQEIFSRAFQALNRFKPNRDANFSTWLYKIGINYSISFLRKSRRQKRGNQQPIKDNLKIAAAENSNPERLVEMEELKTTFKNGLDTLSCRQRTIIVLRYYNGLKIKEIAEHLKCSEGSVKKQIFRALSGLRKKLNVFFKEEKNHEL